MAPSRPCSAQILPLCGVHLSSSPHPTHFSHLDFGRPTLSLQPTTEEIVSLRRGHLNHSRPYLSQIECNRCVLSSSFPRNLTLTSKSIFAPSPPLPNKNQSQSNPHTTTKQYSTPHPPLYTVGRSGSQPADHLRYVTCQPLFFS